MPFQPTLTRSFSTHDSLRVFAPLSWGAHADSATVTLAITGSGADLTQTLTATAVTVTSGLRHATIDQRLLLATLAPGDHILTVSVTLPGEKPATRTVGFRIGGP